ncbi:PE domain-containing protein [Mycolicibacterium wolinskyi]|uniref:PE domain-containing protein n=1 Tax=Mycolicibacterium wolinskyi TaxID=59750 RepID=UPI00082DEA6F|nr:PE domain-containing protein [Mycolicibacterium wolinskyi]
MVALYANEAGISGASGQLAAAAAALAAVAATPPAHAALATDEVSASAAARLSEHGAVMASRAADAAHVLQSAVHAVGEVTRTFADMDRENAAALTGLQAGALGGVAAAMTPAITADLVAPDVPIAPSAARDGKTQAAIMESGQREAGQSFVADCGRYSTAFRQSATAARTAVHAVEQSLRGQTGPALIAALTRFANWADRMDAHAATVARAAAGHRERFSTAQTNTPRTAAFTSKERELANATALNARFAGAYSGVVTQLQGELAALNTGASIASANYHLGELPAAPPPPPPVTPVVGGTTAGARDTQPAPAERSPVEGAAEQLTDTGDAAQDAGEDLAAAAGDAGPDGLPVGDPASAGPGQGDLLSQAAPMAAMLPTMLAGAVGGAIGAVTSIPGAIGQQIQSAASQATQAVQGLTEGLAEPDLGDLDTSGFQPDSLGGLSSGGSGAGGGGGVTEPAGGAPGPLSPGSGNMLAMGGPSAGPTPTISSAAPPAAGPAPAGSGVAGGMPMMMPPMAGAGMGGGGGGTRPAKEPDKTIHLPTEPNSEMVKGQVPRRHTEQADDPTGEQKRAAAETKAAASPAVTVTRRRRIDMPKGDES